MPSDDTPSLDQMRLALLNQIPGQTIRTAPSEWDTTEPGSVAGMNQPVTQQRPLDAVKATFQDLANPFRIVQSMKDAATTLAVKPFVPPAAIISSAVQGLSAAPGIAYRQYLGDPQSMQEAAAIQGSLPTADQLNRQYSQALMPKTAAGQTFEEELGKGFDTAKVPHMWPMSPRGGMVGNITGLEERRPMLSPNDVRVMGAETARVGRQVRDIPTDFVNAQSGLQKLDAITGQPTYGARLQGAAESVGDIVAQREMQGLPAVPGMPAAMQPMNPNMYVIRPFGSTVSQPNVPPSARKGTEYLKFKGNEIDRVITNNLPEKGAPLTPHVALGQYDFAINSNESPDLHAAYNKYINDTLKDMYPSLNQGDRFEALRVLYPDQEDRAQVLLGMVNGFLETPQAKELALRELGHEVPASDQLQQRHDAAVNWLTTRLNDYVSKYIGTSQDPGLSLAAKGMTVLTPDELRQYAGDSTYGVQNRRQTAGYPVEGAFAKPLKDKNAEIDKQTAVVNDLASRKAQEERNARDLGIRKEQHPPWVDVANQAAKGQNQLNKLNTQKGLLEQATNYESLADMAIRGGGVGTEVPPAQRQFWPGSQPAREYIASAEQLNSLGIPEIARKFYDDVMSGKLPVDSIQGLTAPKYIEKLGKAQLATTTNKARLAEEYRQDVTREALATIPANAPVFGNTKVVELTRATPKADALREASLATAVLDVCIGEGGRTSGNKKHFLTGKEQTYESVLLPNGQPNPKAFNKESPYINDVYDKGHTHSVFRDAETGFAVAVLQFKPIDGSGTMYDIGFTSGWHNRNIDPKYVDDVRDYLNSRADSINSISDNTEQHASITDLNDRGSIQNLSSLLGNASRYLDKYDLSGLPRFVLPKDVKTYIEQVNAANPAVSQAVALTDQRPSDSLPAYVTSSMAAVFADVNESQRLTHDNEGESNRIGVSESYFTNMRDSFDELLRAHTPADALTIFINNLDIEENRLANSNRASNNIIADGIVDLRHSANSLLQIGMPRYMAARNAPAPAPAVAEQLNPATDGEIAATRDAIGGAFVFPEASPAVQEALRRIGDTIADMAIPGSETVAQYLDNIDGRVMSQIMNIDEIVDRGDFVPTLLGFTSQADVAMYQQGLDVARTMVQRLQTQLEEGDWVPEPGLLPELAEPMPEPRAVEPAAERQLPALSNEDESVANSILDILEDPDNFILPDNATATQYNLLANSFENDPEQVLGMGDAMLEDAEDRAGVVRYVAEFLRQRARDTRGRAPRGYQKGGAVKKSEDTAAFGIYPNSGIGRQKSDIGDKLNASLVPQDALDLALTVMPFGKVGKTLATAIMAGAPAEAQAGNMSSLLKLVAKEAPEQFHSIREALLRTFNTGLEQSVVGSTRMGGPSQVVGGTVDSVIPSKLDIANARQNIAQSPLIDFHTHPNTQVGSSDFKITPSDADLQYWMSTHGRKTAVPNEIKTMIGSPANRQEGATSSYNFFATDKPGQALNRYTYDAARYELQRSKDLQSLKDNPIVGQYLDAGGTLGDLLQSASPMLLQKLYAQQGLGRHEMRLSNAPTAAPAVTESNLFNEIANPAMEVLRSKFANGGIVQQDPTTDQMRYELMMRRH